MPRQLFVDIPSKALHLRSIISLSNGALSFVLAGASIICVARRLEARNLAREHSRACAIGLP